MLDKLKAWTLHVFECRTQNDVERCSDFKYYTKDTDPRELPRPKKLPSLELPSPADENICQPFDGCSCYNCRELVELTECPICAGNYRQTGVSACEHCGNFTCWQCAARVPACPFCRKSRSAARNTALERLFKKLQLPCSPVRDVKEYDERTACRDSHSCLARKECQWSGELGDLAGHLEADHYISVLVSNGIAIEIAGFRGKVRASDKKVRLYTVSLACYASIFVLNLSLHKKRLRLFFTGASSHSTQRFGAWLEVYSSFRTLKGMMPVSTPTDKIDDLYISCDRLLSPWRPTEGKLKMNITIRPLI